MTTNTLPPLFKGVSPEIPILIEEAVRRLYRRTVTRQEWRTMWRIYRCATGKQKDDVYVSNWSLYAFRPLRRDLIIRPLEERVAYLTEQRARYKARLREWAVSGHGWGRGERAGSSRPFQEDKRLAYPYAGEKEECQCCAYGGYSVRQASRLLCENCLANKAFEQTNI